MSEVVLCPTCGGPARPRVAQTDPTVQPALIAVTEEEMAGRIEQLREIVRV